MSNTWFIVPARGGSKGIPKKNVRVLGDRPLIVHVLKTLTKVAAQEQIIVSTDDEEITAASKPYATIHDRNGNLASDEVTLDEVIAKVADWLIKEQGANENDTIITVQPTSPFLSEQTLTRASELLQGSEIDTVLTVKDDRHLRWGKKEDGKTFPQYKERVNRQWLPAEFVETGGVIGCSIQQILNKGTRIGDNVELLEVGKREGLDIDTYEDWALAEYWVKKLKVVIRLDGSKTLGFGHLYRGLALAECLTLHDVIFLTRNDDEYSLGADFLRDHNYAVKTIANPQETLAFIKKEHPDIVINDILDTEKEYIESLKGEGVFTVNFEDLGPGNQVADIVINDLYPDLYPKENHWYGVEFAILNPQFEHQKNHKQISSKVETILLTFGGTDPNNLTLKALEALEQLDFQNKVKVVVGPGYTHFEELKSYLQASSLVDANIMKGVNNMAELMKSSDLAITSAGRTVTELMVVGVPTIAVCQNIREMRHNHASSAYGIVNLGMGDSLEIEALAKHIKLFIENHALRKDMFLRMKKTISNRSNHNIVDKILRTYRQDVKIEE